MDPRETHDDVRVTSRQSLHEVLPLTVGRTLRQLGYATRVDIQDRRGDHRAMGAAERPGSPAAEGTRKRAHHSSTAWCYPMLCGPVDGHQTADLSHAVPKSRFRWREERRGLHDVLLIVGQRDDLLRTTKCETTP